jgi:hypothetical protein
MSRFVLWWTATGLVLSLTGRFLADFIWFGIFAVYLVWIVTGLSFGVVRALEARHPDRRARSLRDLASLTACGIGVAVLYAPLYTTGRRWTVEYRFASARATYDRIVAELPEGETSVQRLTGPTGEYFIDPGPPVRVAFVLPPGRFVDNWCGVVYDPTGDVMQANRFDGDWASWEDKVPTEIIKLFGGDMLTCRELDSAYYHCCFT